MIVLLSGGVDSTSLLAYAIKQGCNVKLALSLDYGQLHKKELECAVWQAEHFGVPFLRLDIRDVFEGIANPLLGTGGEIPCETYEEQLDKRDASGSTAPVSTYVPNRNMILLSIAAARAMQVGATYVAYGAHLGDAYRESYPDCGKIFVNRMNDVLLTQGIELWAPWIDKEYTKADVIREGLAAGVDFEHTWSCYAGGDEPCGVCGTCRERADSMAVNGIVEKRYGLFDSTGARTL